MAEEAGGQLGFRGLTRALRELLLPPLLFHFPEPFGPRRPSHSYP